MSPIDYVLVAAGGIITIVTAGKALWGIIKPVNKVAHSPQEIDALSKTLNRIDEKMDLLCDVELATLNHIITGNNIENAKSIRDKLQSYICTH